MKVKQKNVTQSMSQKGNLSDNAAIDSFHVSIHSKSQKNQ